MLSVRQSTPDSVEMETNFKADETRVFLIHRLLQCVPILYSRYFGSNSFKISSKFASNIWYGCEPEDLEYRPGFPQLQAMQVSPILYVGYVVNGSLLFLISKWWGGSGEKHPCRSPSGQQEVKKPHHVTCQSPIDKSGFGVPITPASVSLGAPLIWSVLLSAYA